MIGHTVQFYAKSRSAWRNWLKKNHTNPTGIWLILYNKNSKTPCVGYVDSIEEALCFGWIDSKANKRDSESRFQYFAPRKARTGWSRINKDRIARLIKTNLMAAPGLAKIEQAKRDGTWTLLDAIENLKMPADLVKAFSGKKGARENFEAFPSSVKKGILYWIDSARRLETRKERIRQTVELAGKNIRANEWKKP